jgi:hypothetical protein
MLSFPLQNKGECFVKNYRNQTIFYLRQTQPQKQTIARMAHQMLCG